ncbi:MAG: CPBP family intramembrane metalloprotease [Actinobacteria bacterium]|nr:CPBP family intramembrane metalloprotease [Actinomycetota bacterium]
MDLFKRNRRNSSSPQHSKPGKYGKSADGSYSSSNYGRQNNDKTQDQSVMRYVQQEPNIKWNSLDSLISIIFLIAILIGIYFISQKLLSVLNEKQLINLNISNIGNLSFSIFYAIQALLMLGVVWFFAIYWRGASIRDLGFRYYSILKTIWYTFISLLFIFLISFLYVLALKSIFGIEAPPSKIDELVANRNISSNILIIVTAVVAPFCEEIYFRGFLYPAFKKSFGVLAALFLSSFLFSLAHLELYSFIPIMIIGWLLAYIYEKTKSIFTVIFLHSVYNLILISILLGKINFLKLY